MRGFWSRGSRKILLLLLASLATLLFIATTLSGGWLNVPSASYQDRSINILVPVHVDFNFGTLPTLHTSELISTYPSQETGGPNKPGASDHGTINNSLEQFSLTLPSTDTPSDYRPLKETADASRDSSGVVMSTPQALPSSLSSPSTDHSKSPSTSVKREHINVIIIQKTRPNHPTKGTNETKLVEHRSTVVSTYTDSTVSKGLSTEPHHISDRFRIREPCSLPQKYASKPLGVLLHHPWMQELKDFLGGLNSTLVSLVSSDYNYREVLLNWLISAMVKVSPPLSNILVLSLDESLYKLLSSRGFACIHIPPESLVAIRLSGHVGFRQVHIMRLTVMRLINHWGYDVANYDTDAIILKNPEPIYRRNKGVDVIGTFGRFPEELYHLWGVAVCIGVVVIRATQQTELLWEAMSTVQPKTTNDQLRLNLALAAMGITWKDRSADIAYQQWNGQKANFQVAVLPLMSVCRAGTCSPHRISHYYIWHKGGPQSMEGKRKEANVFWSLRGNWETLSSRTNSQGYQWLKEIALKFN